MTTAEPTTPAPDSGSLLDRLMRYFRRKLLGLAVDTGFFLEVMEDVGAGMIARNIAGGVVLYLNHVRDLIPDTIKSRFKLLGLIDDIIVMSIGMSLCMDSMPAGRRAHYEDKYPATKELAADIDQLKLFLALIWERLLDFVRALSKRRYRGQPMEAVVDSPELREALRDQTMKYLATAAIDPEMLDDELKKLPRLDKVAGLLTDALAKDDAADSRSDKDDTPVGWARLNRILGRSDGDSQEP